MKPSSPRFINCMWFGIYFPPCVWRKRTGWCNLTWLFRTEQQRRRGRPHQHNGPPGSATYVRHSFSTPDKVHKAIKASVVEARLVSGPLRLPIISVDFSDSSAKKKRTEIKSKKNKKAEHLISCLIYRSFYFFKYTKNQHVWTAAFFFSSSLPNFQQSSQCSPRIAPTSRL